MPTIINGSSPSITFSDSTTQATALPAQGTAGNVLTSNGSAWVSSAPSGGFNGATETTSATTVTLTSASTQVQAITMTAANKVVQLPNATTLSTEGGPIFVITNKGNLTFSVLQTSGANIAIVYPGQTVQCYLINNSTSAGVWTTDKYGNQIAARDFTFSYGSTGSPMTLPLTTTTGIVFGNVSSILKAKAYSIGADGTVTYGTEVTLLSLSASMPDGCRLTDTTGLIVAAQSSVGSYVVAFSVSGTTITVGTSVQLVTSADGPEYTKLVRLSATTAIAATGKYTPDQTQANFLTISGTSITSNSSTNANVSLYMRGVGIKVKDASVVAFGGIRSATGNVALVTFVYSGTSLTASYYNDLSSSFANQNSNTISITSLSTDAITVAANRNPANGNAPINYSYSVNTSTGEATLEAAVSDALGNTFSNGAFFGVYLGTSGYGITFQGGNLVYATQFNNVSLPRHLVLGPTMFATNMTSLPNILVASDNLFGFAANTNAGPPGLAALYIQQGLI